MKPRSEVLNAPPADVPGVAYPALTLGLLALANFVVSLGATLVIGVLSPVAADFAIGKAEAGSLMTVYAIVYALASPLMVAATGSWDRKRVLVGGMMLFALGSLAAALAPTFTLLLVARALMALGGGLVSPLAASTGVALAAPALRGRALAAVFGGVTLAQVAGVPAGTWLGYTFGWRTMFALVVALTLACALVLWLALPRAIAASRSRLADLGGVLADARLMLPVAFTALFMGGLYVVHTFFGPFLEARLGLGRDGVSAMLLVFGLGAVLGNAMGGFLTDRIGPARTLALLCVTQIVIMPVLTLVPMSLAAAGVLVAAWSVFGWSFMVPQQTRLATLAPLQVGVLFALNASAINVGGAVGSAAGGLLLGGLGFDALGPGGALFVVLALLSLRAGARTWRL